MSDSARLRAQKVFSTDPEYLERMALEAEAREVPVRRLPASEAATGRQNIRPGKTDQG